MKNKRKHTDGVMGVVLALLMIFAGGNAAMAKDVNPDELKPAADAAYSKGNYQEAISGYESLLKQGENADVYYNLGNAYFRSDNITRAVICYEKAHLLNPGNKDINHNLEIARSKTIDNIQQEESIFFVSWYNGLRNSLSIDAWATVALVSLIVALVLFLVYLFAKEMVIRKLSFYGSAILVIVFILGNIFAWQLKDFAVNNNGAIVTAATVNVKKTPTAQSADACVIHEGTKVNITDSSLKGWYEITLADGREGWIADKTVELLR